MIKKLVLSFLQAYQEKPEKTRGALDSFGFRELKQITGTAKKIPGSDRQNSFESSLHKKPCMSRGKTFYPFES
jgi:hypothetical protein